MRKPGSSLRLLAAAVATLAAGCAVGPEFRRPAPPEAAGYTPPSAPPPAAVGGQTLHPGAEVSARWWTAFGSDGLNLLVERALKHNSDLAAARAALSASRQTYLAAVGSLYPAVEADLGTSRNKSSQYLSPPLNAEAFYYSLQSAQLNISYTLDLFGGVRRQVEAAKAEAEQQRFQTEGTYLTLVSNVVVAALTEASLRRQVAAEEHVIATAADILAILRRQLAAGAVARGDVLLQEAALAQAQAALPPLRKLLATEDDLLAYLVGATAADARLTPLDLDRISLPADLPLTLPSRLVAQRPDVRAAEAALHQASANVGVAIAARLPGLTLSAAGGGYGSGWSNVLSQPDQFWSYGAQLAQPLLQGGALYRRQKAAEASLTQAKELYRSAVLSAFQNVSDALQALEVDASALQAAERAQKSAVTSLEIARRQLALGQVAGVVVLNAEQTLGIAEVALVQARAARLTDTAALFQALGGGWEHRSGPA